MFCFLFHFIFWSLGLWFCLSCGPEGWTRQTPQYLSTPEHSRQVLLCSSQWDVTGNIIVSPLRHLCAALAFSSAPRSATTTARGLRSGLLDWIRLNRLCFATLSMKTQSILQDSPALIKQFCFFTFFQFSITFSNLIYCDVYFSALSLRPLTSLFISAEPGFPIYKKSISVALLLAPAALWLYGSVAVMVL